MTKKHHTIRSHALSTLQQEYWHISLKVSSGQICNLYRLEIRHLIPTNSSFLNNIQEHVPFTSLCKVRNYKFTHLIDRMQVKSR